MINFLKQWEGHIGDMKITQTAQPTGNGESLLILTGFYGARGYHCASSTMPFADAEKLAADGFRAELARRDITEMVTALRQDVELAEKALAAALLQEPLALPFASMTEEEARNWHIRRDERNGRHTP